MANAGKIIVAVAIMSAVCLNLRAQEGESYSREFRGGARVGMSKMIITEFRSHSASANPAVPAEEICDNKEWKLITYSMKLEIPGSDATPVIWEITLEYPLERIRDFPMTTQFAVEDTLLRDSTFYIIYSVGKSILIGGAKRGTDGNWINLPRVILATDYETRPIRKARFVDAKKPQIVMEYLEGHDDKFRAWTWTLEKDLWERK